MSDEALRRISRRSFLKGTAVGAAGVAASGMLGGCQAVPVAAPECPPCPTAEPAAAAVPQGYAWETAPAAIPQSDIKVTNTAEVVVIGAGIAGLTAAASASEAGAKVVLLEKSPTLTVHGLHNAAVNSRLQKAAGLELDRDTIVSDIMQWGAFRTDQRVVSVWADRSAEVMNWLLDLAEAAQIEVILDPTTKPWYFRNYPTIHIFRPAMQGTLAAMLQDHALANGADLRFETPAVRLLREGQGRVTGVIAQNTDGDYVQVDASKGVILCTGDYGNDKEMIERYCDWRAQNLTCGYQPAVNTGDGHKMGMWVGAAIDNTPHSVMYFDNQLAINPPFPGLFNLGRQPWLYVNTNGERFMNEDIPWGFEVAQFLQQPENRVWPVWDSKWEEEVPGFQSQCCKNMQPPGGIWNPDWLTQGLESGNVLQADSLEELAGKMGVPVETFVATTTRYTELARKGHDDDFGKHPTRLTALEKPPYYSCQIFGWFLVTLGGLKINPQMQVLDTNRQVIPGLYAAGNASGNFFGDMYPTVMPGLSHGRAWTFGRLAGLHAATGKA